MTKAVAHIYVFVLIMVTIPTIRASEKRDIEADVAAHPDDVDLRLRYAIHLSHEGDLEAAQKEAHRVISKAPDYLDAHLLLARIAGWQHHFEEAIDRVDIVLAKSPKNAEAIALKLDILKWMQDHAAAAFLLKRLIRASSPPADIYLRLAELERSRRQHLSAYRHAKAALRIDPNLTRAKTLLAQIQRATFYVIEELEYHGFKGESARHDKLGMGLHVAGTAFQGALLSATLTESYIYRFRTINNQVGLQIDYQPFRRLGLVSAVKLGLPAAVIPKGSFMLAIRGELFKRLDAALSETIDILAWPDTDPALLFRTALTTGVFITKRARVAATYTLGLLGYCGYSPQVTHGGSASGTWTDERFSVNLIVGFAQEGDPVAVGVSPPGSCAELRLLVERAEGGDFRLVNINTVHSGLGFTLTLNPKASIKAGYRFEGRKTETNPDTILAHISHLGLVVWF